MGKAITPKGIFKEEDEKIRQLYENAVGPNDIQNKKGFIKCPECGEEILITSTLRKMSEQSRIMFNFTKRNQNLISWRSTLNRLTFVWL